MVKVVEELASQKTLKDKKIYLGDHYPSLYHFALKHFKQYKELKDYMQECKNLENFPGIPIKYSLYIHGYLIPWFQ